MRNGTKQFLVIAGVLAALGRPVGALAQPAPATPYPAKTVRIVVPSSPSGGTDLIGRLAAQKAGEAWGQTVLIDNISGGATRIGINTVAKAAPDGYTLLLTTVNFAFAPALYAKLPYDPLNDFAPVVQVANTTSLLAVHPVVPAKNVAELIALARAKPDELRYGFGGNGSVGHLVGAMFQSQARIRLLQVPYKGTGPAATALLGGEIHTMIANMASLLPYARAGRLRGLAVAGAARSPISSTKCFAVDPVPSPSRMPGCTNSTARAAAARFWASAFMGTAGKLLGRWGYCAAFLAPFTGAWIAENRLRLTGQP